MKFTVIVTFGPSLQSEQKLKDIAALGDVIFRINGAHSQPTDVPETVSFIKSVLPND